MKPTFTLLTALLLAACTSANAGLVAHYRFDGDLKDATGRHDGRPVDAKLAPVFAPGRVGSAVVIEKVNAGIELANPSAIDFSRDFTLATWVNVGNYYAEMPVLFKGRANLTAAPDKFFGVEKPIVTLTINPTTPCVHPVFELQNAPKTLSRVELNGRELAATGYAWDGRTLWLNATLRDQTQLRLEFAAN